jgi:gliding motility-associated lipoprotein GldD
VAFNENYCQFTFQQPKYMRMVQDTSFFGERPANACWFNLDIPAFNGSIHFTYTPLRNASDLFKVYDDAYRLANEHNRKADANSDYVFTNDDNRVYGLLFEIEGQVASPFQFVLTDSSRHALRGALYFNNKPEPDSMRPIIAFVRRDMVHMMNTLRWE